MSVGFGFSIGDIVLMSQLAYRLYTAITARESASKELRNLGNALFDLHCALDHLQKTAQSICEKVLDKMTGSEGLWKSLHSMIDSCASTLNELAEATKTHRDTVLNLEIEDKSLPDFQRYQRILERWKHQLKAQWNKVQWDFKRDSLETYQRRIISHTVSINMVLSSFIWSATERLETNNQEQTNILQRLRDQGIKINDEMMEAFEQMRNLMLSPAQNSATDSHVNNHESMRINLRYQVKWGIGRPPNQPEICELINASRRAIGLIQQLRQGIKLIIGPLPDAPTNAEIEARQQEVVVWIESVNENLKGSGDVVKANSMNEMTELLIDLNQGIETCDDLPRQIFYNAADQAGFCWTLIRVRLWSSVRCVREIDEFEEMRLEWNEAHKQKRKWENVD